MKEIKAKFAKRFQILEETNLTQIFPVYANAEQLQNTGPLLKVYISEWLAGSAVAVVLEERARYIREWLGGSPARQWPLI